MKRIINVSFLTVAVALSLGRPTFAQRGHNMGSSMSHSSSTHAASSAKGGEQSMTQKLTDNTKLADRISKLTGMSARNFHRDVEAYEPGEGYPGARSECKC